MIAACMTWQNRPVRERSEVWLELWGNSGIPGEWFGPDTLDHNNHGDSPVPVSGPYESPNLILWTGSIHHAVLVLKDEW